MFKRYEHNPILEPIKEHEWEAAMVYNCGAIYEGGKVHIVYRAQGKKGGVSTLGYASSRDGLHIDERLPHPIFEPVGEFESRGCEDPRLTRIGDRIYVCYSAVGKLQKFVGSKIERYSDTIQIAVVSISVTDFLNHNWNWSKRIYPFPRVDNKNCCIFPEKINGKYVMYHRIPPHIWIAYSDDLENWYDINIFMRSEQEWEYFKIGVGAPPIKTDKGWLFIYHGVSKEMYYCLGLAFIDINDPRKVIWRSKQPILEPEKQYEQSGYVPFIAYTCGAVVIQDTLFLYYGGADTVTCVATASLSGILDNCFSK